MIVKCDMMNCPWNINTDCSKPLVPIKNGQCIFFNQVVRGYMMPVEREFVSPDFVRLGTQLACAEMIRSGVTTFADMYYFETVVAEVLDSAGLRGVVGQTLADFDPPDHRDFDEDGRRRRDRCADERRADRAPDCQWCDSRAVGPDRRTEARRDRRPRPSGGGVARVRRHQRAGDELPVATRIVAGRGECADPGAASSAEGGGLALPTWAHALAPSLPTTTTPAKAGVQLERS